MKPKVKPKKYKYQQKTICAFWVSDKMHDAMKRYSSNHGHMTMAAVTRIALDRMFGAETASHDEA